MPEGSADTAQSIVAAVAHHGNPLVARLTSRMAVNFIKPSDTIVIRLIIILHLVTWGGDSFGAWAASRCDLIGNVYLSPGYV